MRECRLGALCLLMVLGGCNGLSSLEGQPGSDGGQSKHDGFVPRACNPACTPPTTCSAAGLCIDPGTCVQDEDCKAGEVCDPSTKRCVTVDKCGAQELKVNVVAPSLLVVLDRSCSMRDKVAGKMKFDIAVSALKNLLTKNAGKIRFGLTLFPDITGASCTQDAIPIPVAPAVDTNIQSLLTAALDAADKYYPDGPCVTNIDTAMQQAASEPALKDATRQRFVLLITDGKQSGCSAAGGDAGTTQIITALHQQKISTFVVGFGAEVDPAQLNIFADAGGKPSGDPITRYYKAEDQASLDAALAKIVQQSFGCVFKLQQPPPTLNKVYVFFDGKEVPQDATHQNGWDYDAATHQMTFYGASCHDLEQNKVADLDVVYGCKKPLDPGSCSSGKTCQKNDECGSGYACVSSCCTKVLE